MSTTSMSGMSPVEKHAREMFNQPALVFPDIVRVIGYGRTAVDQYYIVQAPHKGVYWLSAAGGPISLACLKGQDEVTSRDGTEVWDDFVRLDKDLEHNGCPKAETFLVEIREDDNEDLSGNFLID